MATKTPQFTAHEVMEIAVKACTTTRSVQARLAGKPLRAGLDRRIDRVVARHLAARSKSAKSA
jgi:hypothetical protein